jgi:hypothetical protein
MLLKNNQRHRSSNHINNINLLRLHRHGLHHVRHELGMNVRISNLLVKQLTHSAGELRGNLLRLITTDIKKQELVQQSAIRYNNCFAQKRLHNCRSL